MTIKEKLLSKGFKQAPYDIYTYLLAFNKDFDLVCVLDKAGSIQEWYIDNTVFFTSQEQIDTLQIAFNRAEKLYKEITSGD
jgi:predicted RNA-binding protein associated with RNAse of E/G family